MSSQSIISVLMSIRSWEDGVWSTGSPCARMRVRLAVGESSARKYLTVAEGF